MRNTLLLVWPILWLTGCRRALCADFIFSDDPRLQWTDADKGNTRLLISAMTKHMRGTGVLVPSKSGRADDEEPSAPGPNVAKKQVDIFTAAKRGDTARLRELIQVGGQLVLTFVDPFPRAHTDY